MRTDAARLRAALRILRPLASTRPTFPVLDHVRLEAKDGRLAIVATDCETRGHIEIPADGELGPVLVPAKRFASLLDAAGAKRGELILEPEGTRVVAIVAGRRLAIDAPIPAAEFPTAPALPPPTAPVTYRHPDTFAKALKWLLPAVSTDVTRPMLMGLCFERRQIFACDGHRLHVVGGMPAFGAKALLPRPAAQTLLAFLDACTSGPVRLEYGEKVFSISAARRGFALALSTRAIDAEAPDFGDVIPRADATTARVSAAELDRALALATKVSRRSSSVRLVLNGALMVEAEDADTAASESVAATRIAGNSAEVQAGFNAAYLRDSLAGAEGDALLGLTDRCTPMTVRFAGDQTRLAVVMPIRL